MNDNVSYRMAADYKVYELRQVITDLKDLADNPLSRKAVKPYWEDMYKSAQALKDLLNNMPPWDEDND
jgi:hypothetical protein